MKSEEENIEEFPEEEDFDSEEIENDDDDFNDDDAEELFRQNPLRAIFVRQSEILEMLNES